MVKKNKRSSPTKGRSSPSKDTTKKSASFLEKNSPPMFEEPLKQRAYSISHESFTMEDDLLTPEILLKDYADKKNGPTTPSKTPQELETPQPTTNSGPSILELLSKKDNLEKLADSVSKVYPLDTIPTKTPPTTPPKRANSERFAGLSNSPAPSTLPLPSFSFLDQELRIGNREDETKPLPVFALDNFPATLTKHNSAPAIQQPTRMRSVTVQYPSAPLPMKQDHHTAKTQSAKTPAKNQKNRKPSPPTRQKADPPRTAVSAPPRYNPNVTPSVAIPMQQPYRTMNHSPPSNPHLDELSSQLRMMLNITPVQS